MRLGQKQAEYLKNFAGHDFTVSVGCWLKNRHEQEIVLALVKKGLLEVVSYHRDLPFSARATSEGRALADTLRAFDLLENPSNALSK